VDNCGQQTAVHDDIPVNHPLDHTVQWQVEGQSGTGRTIHIKGVGPVDIYSILANHYPKAGQEKFYSGTIYVDVSQKQKTVYSYSWTDIIEQGQMFVNNHEIDYTYHNYLRMAGQSAQQLACS
jgi:hypothetical protein